MPMVRCSKVQCPESFDTDTHRACPYCGTPAAVHPAQQPQRPLANVPEPLPAAVPGLALVYQKTLQTIQVAPEPEVIIGCEAIGRDILGSIRNSRNKTLVSRRHCRIQWCEGGWYLSDCNSTNGTSILKDGVKVDCVQNPNQRIADGDQIFLGRELFIASFTRAPAGAPRRAVEYRCTHCGRITAHRPTRCADPDCPDDNEFEEVFPTG